MSAAPPRFRRDIEGMRALAVLAVVAYHAGVPLAGGGYVGVDVFFVLSGYLITRQLLTELEAHGRISISRFYARRVRRLLPASALVVFATLVASWVVLNPLRIREVASDALWTLVYALNWNLAREGTDYLTATAPPSPLQHFWSLAIEEQFYLVWPVLMLLASGAMFTHGRRVSRRGLLVVLAVVIVLSLYASVRLTVESQPWAYFGLHTRAWELAAGAVVALTADRLARTLSPTLAGAGTWVGVLLVLVSVVAYDETTAFPGFAATLPVGATALVLAAGCGAPRAHADALLARRPMQWLGAMSYGWYLWHWPLLLLVPAFVGRELQLWQNVLLVVLALALAWLSYTFVEHPIRSMTWPTVRPWRALAMGGAVSVALAVLAVVVPTLLPAKLGSGEAAAGQALDAGDARRSVADAVARGLGTTTAPVNLEPSLREAPTKAGRPLPHKEDCHGTFALTVPRTDCVYGDVAAERAVVLFGDSHALQWFPALDTVARDAGYRLVVLTKSSCTPISTTIWSEALRRPYTECDTWRGNALRHIAALRPHTVVVSTYTGLDTYGLHGGGEGFDRAWVAGTRTTVTALKNAGSRVLMLGDTAVPPSAVPDCVADHPANVTACVFERTAGELEPQRRAAQQVAAAAAGARTVDPVPWTCSADRCPVIVDNLLVYRDDSHLSTAYSAWLAPLLAAELKL